MQAVSSKFGHILRLQSSISESTENAQHNTVDNSCTLKVAGQSIVDEKGLNAIYGTQAFHELPIVHVYATRNNTKISLTDCNGRCLCGTTCGTEGFRNARKQTTVAAQTVGISIGLKAQKLGISAVRVKLRGLGVNRVSTLSGMVLSGLKIVSLTDDTPINYGMGRRPKKTPRK
nr:unnamed protein product [Spirometra erinaceieuropaei]